MLGIDIHILQALDIAISSNLVPFVGLAFLLFVVRANPLFDRYQTRLFTIAILINITLLVVISADYIFAEMGRDGYAWVARRFTSFINFAASPTIPFLLFCIFKRGVLKKRYLFPLILNFVICFASMFFQIVFNISEANTYARGPLFFLPFAISVLYIGLLIVQPGSTHSRQQKTERVFLLGIIALLAVGMTLEIALGLRFISWDCSAIGIVSYYLLLNMHYSTLDSLTGIYSRSVYTKRLASFEHTSAHIVALADINDFKTINDEQGHDAGDEALIVFATILNESFAGVATPYRIGGDEFALIAETEDMATFEQCLEKAHEAARTHNLEFACGYAVHRVGEDADEISKRIDQAMYLNKKQMKSNARS